jgi:hypothetical protein
MSNPINEDDADLARELPPAARELEAALSDLRPADAGASNPAWRDQLMFRAGEAAGVEKQHAAAARQLWAWRGVAAALAAVAITIFARVAEPGPTRQRVVYVQVERPASRSTPAAIGASLTERSSDLTARRDGDASDETTAEPGPSVAANRIGVRGDYLTIRTAVLRWGIAALPREPVVSPTGRPAPVIRASTVFDLLGDDERPIRAAPSGPLEQIDQWFTKTVTGGRL